MSKESPFNDTHPAHPSSPADLSPRRISWPRILRVCLLFAPLLAIVLLAKPITSSIAGSAEQSASPSPPAALSKQDVILIWTAVAEQRYPVYAGASEVDTSRMRAKRKPVVLLDRSTQTCPVERPEKACGSNLDQKLLSSTAAHRFVSAKARQALLLANAAQVQVRLPESTYVHGASTDHVDALLTDINWPAFYQAYPGTAGYLQLSVPVVVDGSHSLAYAEQRCDGRCGTGMLYLLARTGKGWKITKRLELWVS
ncbi:hypothetical protein [Xanthomonas sp. 10-10]|uniref:DUF4440 domain-containing protein n=1 Tax=Xanthomonas sp. 10-10 TaxID=3115848 RepID=A0AAU7P8B0_9XANT